MEKPDVLQVGPMNDMLESETEALRDQYEVHKLFDSEDPDTLIETLSGRLRTIVTNGHAGASAELMGRFAQLDAVVCFGAGVDNVDLAYAAANGIQVSNTPEVLNDDVANLAVGLMLASSRALVEGDKYVRRGDWLKKGNMPLQKAIRGARVGILGLGGIGKEVARKLEVFGCEIVYHGRRQQEGVAYPYYEDLVEMAEDCSYLILVCPATSETLKIVNREVLDALGSEGTLINIARGSVVDEAALVAALQEGRLGAAALDVFENEPMVPEELLEMPNVVLVPHVGSATVATRKAMGQLVLKNLSLVFEGKPVATPVSI